MVHGIIYFVLLAIIIVANTYHHLVERNLKAEINWWRKKAVKNENELNALKKRNNLNVK